MSNTQKMEWALRIGVAGEFLGHGLLAIGKKPDWIKWMTQLTPFDAQTASTLIVIIGIVDVLVALTVLFRPIQWVLIYATIWGFWTALVRPLVGVGWLDFIERFANWGAPLALYYFYKVNKR